MPYRRHRFPRKYRAADVRLLAKTDELHMRLSGRRWVAGIISWLTFTLVHLGFFGLGPTLKVGVFAVIVVILFILAKSIWPAIIVHGISDIVGFLIGPFVA